MASTRRTSSPALRGLDPLDSLPAAPNASARRRRLVEAASYARAIQWLDEGGHLDDGERAALLADADGEIAEAVAAAATPADPAERRRRREESER